MAKARFYNDSSQYADQEEVVTEARYDRMKHSSETDIWEKMAEDQLYEMLRSMGTHEKVIKSYQVKRVVQTVLVFGVFAVIGVTTNMLAMYILGAIVAFFVYRSRFTGIVKMYSQWKFERELNFSKFIRLLIPYLKGSGGNVSLYNVFNKILVRMDDETDRASLYSLMGEMGDRPGDIQPFNDFAERSSGSDMAYLIMSTIFDFQESTKDVSVINELGQMASEQMLDAIDEIIAFKIRRFGAFPTKLTISTFIVMGGFMIGVFSTQISTFFTL